MRLLVFLRLSFHGPQKAAEDTRVSLIILARGTGRKDLCD